MFKSHTMSLTYRYQSINQSNSQSVSQSTNLWIYLSIYLSIYRSIYLAPTRVPPSIRRKNSAHPVLLRTSKHAHPVSAYQHIIQYQSRSHSHQIKCVCVCVHRFIYTQLQYLHIRVLIRLYTPTWCRKFYCKRFSEPPHPWANPKHSICPYHIQHSWMRSWYLIEYPVISFGVVDPDCFIILGGISFHLIS